MPHPKHRKQDTRRKILAAAARLFGERGFEATSIDDVMQACGLTRGGFYLHFRSKAELHAEALRLAPTARPGLDDLFTAALGTPHLTGWANLALDVGSTTPEVRRGYARSLQEVCARLGDEMAHSAHGEAAAQAVAAMLVGALAVARTVDDPTLRHRMAEACRTAAQALRESPPAPEPLFFWSVADVEPSHTPLH